MPIEPLPTDLPAAINRIRELEQENAVLKTQADHSVGGFLQKNVTKEVLLAIAALIAAALGGTALYQNQNTRTDLQQTQEKQAAITGRQDETSKRVDTLDSKIPPPLVFKQPEQAPGKWLPKD